MGPQQFKAGAGMFAEPYSNQCNGQTHLVYDSNDKKSKAPKQSIAQDLLAESSRVSYGYAYFKGVEDGFRCLDLQSRKHI